MKKQLLFLFAALLPLVASAQTKVEIDGIWYNLITEAKTAEVTFKGDSHDSYNNEYSGSITIPATVTYDGVAYSVTSIGEWAFGDCSSLTSITLPEGVTSIGYAAFSSCSSLTAITIPEGVTSIGSYAFSYCSSLTAITVAEGNAQYDSRGGCNAIIETNSNTLIAGCSTTIIPEGVTSIGGSAFSGCSSLTAINIPASVTSIGNYAFSGCSSLTSITISEGVTSIGDYAFCECSSLTAITLPESVTSIGNSAFYYCSSLTAINIPGSVTSIGVCAFSECSSLTSITLPEGVTSIGYAAFSSCSSLTTITLPESVTSIGNSAFYNCSSLTAITCHAVTPPTIASYTFYEVNKSIPVYVPAGSVEAYKAAAYWNEFTNYVGIETGIENPVIRNHKSEITFDLRGRRVDNPVKGGIYIVGGKKMMVK